MLNYAKFTHDHEYAPVVLYATFFGGSKGKEKAIERRAMKDPYRVFARVVSLIPFAKGNWE
jgi:hypothetical protein